MQEKKMSIMAVGGHIGDMELTAGGLLATMALKGCKTVTVALTAGEKGNPPHIPLEDYRRQKISEARNFAELTGGEALVYPCDDGTLSAGEDVKFWLADKIRLHKPEILITHWRKSMHKDHIAAHDITRDARFYAALPGFERDLPPHGAKSLYFAENWEDPEGFERAVYFEVSDEGFELWKSAVQNHWFIMNSSSFRYYDYYCHLKELRGIEARKSYAEAYNVESFARRIIISAERG